MPDSVEENVRFDFKAANARGGGVVDAFGLAVLLAKWGPCT